MDVEENEDDDSVGGREGGGPPAINDALPEMIKQTEGELESLSRSRERAVSARDQANVALILASRQADEGVEGAAEAAVAAGAAKEEAETRILATEKNLAAVKFELNKLMILEREGYLLWDADPDGNCLTSSLVDQMVYAAQTDQLDIAMNDMVSGIFSRTSSR